MGYSQTWIAVTGVSRQAIRERLFLQGTGAREEFPESPIVDAVTPNDTTLVVTDHAAQRILRDEALRSLSSDCQLISCAIEEHCMVSSAAEWKLGCQTWSVQHDSGRGMFHLNRQGAVPAEFDAIYEALRVKQDAAGGAKAKVDYIFDAPLNLAQALTGFRHDLDFPEFGKDPFEVLISTAKQPETITWWRRLFRT